jgi:hypothetical protein
MRRALGDFGAERGVTARAANSGNMELALLRLRQREKGGAGRPCGVRQRRVDAVIGDHGKAEAFEARAEIVREGVCAGFGIADAAH